MPRAWLFLFITMLLVFASSANAPAPVAADVSLARVEQQGDASTPTVAPTVVRGPAVATVIPTPVPVPRTIGEGANMTFMTALLVIAGGAVLLWRRQRRG